MKTNTEPFSTSRIGPILALSYLYLPFLIFDLGWIRPIWSVPIAVVSLVGFVLVYRKLPALWIPSWSWRMVAKALSCALLLGLWVWSSGIGGYVWGNIDHLARNTLFKLLVEKPWPLYSMGTPGLPPDAELSILTYYIGFFLPSAVIGKLTSLSIGFLTLWCWAFFGVCLAYYLLCAKLEKLLVWPVLIFVFFSGADAIGVIIRGLHHPGVIPFWSATANFEQWSAYNYVCQTTQLYWLYNQSIPAWIATALLLCGIPASCMLFVASTLMLNATFSFIAFCILSIAFAWTALSGGPVGEPPIWKAKRWLRSFLSIPNVIGPVVIGIPCFLYLSSNTAGGILGLYFHWTYPLFAFLEVVLLFLPFIGQVRRNAVLQISLVALLLIPFGKIGEGCAGDFFRISIPFLFVLMSLYISRIAAALDHREFRKLVFPVAILLLGILTPLHEMSRTFVQTRAIRDISAFWIANNKPESLIMQYGLYPFTAPIDGNRFCECLAKRPR